MKPNDIPIEVFENELIPYADRYFKKVIINSKNTYFKEIIKLTKVWNRICSIQQV